MQRSESIRPEDMSPGEQLSARLLFWEAYVHSFWENSVAAIVAVDCLGCVTIFNQQAEHIFSLTAQSVLGRPLNQVFPLVADHEHYLLQSLKKRQDLKDVEYSYCPYTEQEGSFVHNVALVILPGERLGGAIWVRKDVSALRSFQKEIRLAEVEALVWQMAAGIAHEIRNPLASARGHIQLARQLCTDQHPLAEYLEIAVEEIDQITQIISYFPALVRPQPETLPLVNLNELTEDLLRIVDKVVTMSDIRLSWTLNSSLPLIPLDVKQVSRALLSILLNAMQAMLQGGALKVETSYDASHEEISVTISDTGIGIAAENLRQVFNPLFSTKEAGNGLGLTLANRILQRHNGRIEVASELGQGTTVRLCFPANNN